MFIKPNVFIETLKNKTSSNLSHRYYGYDNVESIYIENRFDRISYYVNASVNVLGDVVECSFIYDKIQGILNYECECPYCNSDSACAHIGVVILTLEDLQPQTFPYAYNNAREDKRRLIMEQLEEQRRKRQFSNQLSNSLSFIEARKLEYQIQIQASIQDSKFEIVPFLSFGNYGGLCLDFKVGNQKKYVIKDISKFLNLIENQSIMKYGKNLAFVHKKEAFDELALQQIVLMNKINTQPKKDCYYYDSSKRELLIEDKDFDLFFDTYFETDIDGSNFVCVDNNDTVQIYIKEEEKYFKIGLDSKIEAIFGKKNYYLFETGETIVIHRYHFDDQGHVINLIKKLDEEELLIEKEEYPNFYKYVLADILSYLEINSTSFEIIEPYEELRLYSDIDEQEQIYLTLQSFNESHDTRLGFDEDTTLNSINQDIVETYIEQYASVIDRSNHIAYLDIDMDKTYTFLKEGLPYLANYCSVYVSDRLKNIGVSKSYNIQVGVRLENNLLEVDVISSDIPKEELADVLSSYRKKRKFHKLKNGELLHLESNELEELNQFMNEYNLSSKLLKNDKIHMQMYRAFAFDEFADNASHLKVQREDSFAHLLTSFKKIDSEEYEVPKQYDDILREYQKSGYQWLRLLADYGFNGVLADDMGLGKTLQVITLLESIKAKTSIVICPASLLYNWEEEIYKFTKNLKILCIKGNAIERKNAICIMSEYDVVITSYDYIRRDFELYHNFTFEYIIIDEAQFIKNQKTKNAYSVKQLHGNHKIALTGTPIENSLAELWSIFDFLMPDYLFNYHYFQSHYETAIVKNKDESKQEELRKLVSPFMLRRVKKEVLKELPDKIENTYIINFSEEERKLYYAHLVQVNEELQRLSKLEHMDKIAVLAMLTKLRQICCEPRLLFENITTRSSKLNACINLVENFKENKKKILLFSSFTSMLGLIAEVLYEKGISYYMLTGKTSKEDRKQLVYKFQNDDTTVFLISLKAGGTGLNLTAAEGVIHFDPWWNMSAQNQATDRAHRIGQTKNLQVYKLIMKNSIEEKIMNLQLQKKLLSDTFVENNEGSISKMNTDDIIELFKI